MREDFANGSSVGGIKSWLKEPWSYHEYELATPLQAAQIKNDRKETWGSAADVYAVVPKGS